MTIQYKNQGYKQTDTSKTTALHVRLMLQL